jgi:Rrf2 family protein
VELSCKTEYGILALIELAAAYKQGEPLQIRQIAAMQNIPDRYLEQLLATLRRCGLIRSQRGARGGYLLIREPWKITLAEVVDCLEGADAQPTEDPDALSRSLESSVIREVWQEVHNTARAVLKRYTLQDLCDKRDARKQLDIMYYI